MAENYATTGLKKLKPLFTDGKRYLVVQGGMRAAKSYSIMMLIISWCQTYPDKIATVASMSYPHLSRGVIRDFQNIMKAADIWEPDRWNQSSKIYTFGNGTILEFISVDNMSAHGPARDLLFINEANDMDIKTAQNLAFRTTGKVIIDYNPTHEFWAHTWLLKEEADKTDFIILTYKDNEALAPAIREAIESRKPKPGEKPSNWWTVYGLGQIEPHSWPSGAKNRANSSHKNLSIRRTFSARNMATNYEAQRSTRPSSSWQMPRVLR